MQETFIIIGAGQSGGEAAQALRQKGFAGRVILIGSEAHAPYERPPLSKKLLAGEMPLERTFIRPRHFYDDKQIELRTSTEVEAIDRQKHQIILGGGEVLSYDKLLIATGARARRLDLKGQDLQGVHYLRTIDESQAIGAEVKPGCHLVAIGAGYVGLEVAAVARRLGAEVTVIEALPRIMARSVPRAISSFYQAEHEAAGVTFRLGSGVSRFIADETGQRVAAIELGDGEIIKADIVVVGVGILPNVELAQAAGLATDNGIVVDEFTQTSDPDICASGDCTSHPNAIIGGRVRLESVQNAVSQGKTAAMAMIGMLKAYTEVPWFWSDQYDLKLQGAGLPDPGDKIVIRGNPENRSFSAFNLRGGRIVAVTAINDMKSFVAGRRWIGEGKMVDPADLANPDTVLKSL